MTKSRLRFGHLEMWMYLGIIGMASGSGIWAANFYTARLHTLREWHVSYSQTSGPFGLDYIAATNISGYPTWHPNFENYPRVCFGFQASRSPCSVLPKYFCAVFGGKIISCGVAISAWNAAHTGHLLLARVQSPDPWL